ncbi:TBCC domain-containing protein 1-like, partial [Mizuhopecten yessoensis]|uniref:TBCC domain-containing protein 1-like n=1 Tax=Mizuhopecten yessoensis TaxID=6573 RepID=UPI000B458133
MTEHAVCLWVKAEPFSYGAFPIAPHPRLTFSNIKKIVIYAKNKGHLGFPRINYSVWRHIACNKLHLTEDLAWMYFSTCHLFCEDLSAMERIERDQEMAACSSQPDRVRWPTVRSSSPDLDGTGRSTPRGNKTLDDHSHMVFVQNHIHEILELLVEPDVLSSVGPGDQAVSLVALEALGFLVAGSVDKCKSLLPIQDIALLQTVQHRTGYSK